MRHLFAFMPHSSYICIAYKNKGTQKRQRGRTPHPRGSHTNLPHTYHRKGKVFASKPQATTTKTNIYL